MAKLIKEVMVMARVDSNTNKKITEYIAAADISMSDLVRFAVEEYIRNHPRKEPEPLMSLKPGE